jgi:hypothetical protein
MYTIYNDSAVKIYNDSMYVVCSQVRFKNKSIFFYFEKLSSPLKI